MNSAASVKARHAGISAQGSAKILPDFISSVVVFLIAVPLCMGISIASGVPPALGLITGIIGGIVVGTISGSPLQVSGPAAGLAVVVFELVHDAGVSGIGPVLLCAGLMQFLAGRFKLGQWFRAISPAVVYGMLAGIGVLIMASQFNVMFDNKPRASGIDNLLAVPASISKAFFPPEGAAHHLAALIGVFTLATIVLWNWVRPKRLKIIPGTLVGVVAGTAVTGFLQLPIQHVAIPDNLWGAVSLPTISSVARLLDPNMFLSAVVIAVLASAETMLSAAAVDRMHSGKPANFDKELAAQGVGNFLCGVLGALPMTGVIVRSSANVQAGARTRLSAILHGVWILSFVLLFPSVLRLVPTASLAAILVFTGFKLIDASHVRHLAGYGRMPIVIYGATVAGIVCIDLLAGVVIGLALTVGKLLWKASRLEIKVFSDANQERDDLHLEGVASFLRLPQLSSALESIPPNRCIHLHIERLYYIDHTCLDLLRAVAAQRSERGGKLEVQWEHLVERYHMRHLDAPASRVAA
jgi:MFS superfamily sulfate permease-like transporter